LVFLIFLTSFFLSLSNIISLVVNDSSMASSDSGTTSVVSGCSDGCSSVRPVTSDSMSVSAVSSSGFLVFLIFLTSFFLSLSNTYSSVVIDSSMASSDSGTTSVVSGCSEGCSSGRPDTSDSIGVSAVSSSGFLVSLIFLTSFFLSLSNTNSSVVIDSSMASSDSGTTSVVSGCSEGCSSGRPDTSDSIGVSAVSSSGFLVFLIFLTSFFLSLSNSNSSVVKDSSMASSDSGTTSVVSGCSEGCSDRKSTRLNSSHVSISYAVFCLKKNKTKHYTTT